MTLADIVPKPLSLRKRTPFSLVAKPLSDEIRLQGVLMAFQRMMTKLPRSASPAAKKASCPCLTVFSDN